MAARLIGDIGGTNARFALVEAGRIARVARLPVAGHASFDAALDAYLAAHRDAPITAVAIAAAGPRDRNAVSLTNAPWTIDGDAISRRLRGAPTRILNDLEAVALGLPALGPSDVEVLSPGAAGGGALPMLAANVGTGFGAAVAVPARGGWAVLGTEAGHMSLVPADPSEASLFADVQSVEDAFSGPGYARLLGGAAEEGGEFVHPADGNGDDRAEERRLYSRVFGRVLGDLALATGAWGGVYLCGGVISDLHRIFDVDAILQAFRDKDKMTPRMPRIPILRITLDAPAFHSLATAEID
jgi:glucokinase